MAGTMRKTVELDKDVYTLAHERTRHAYELFDTVGVAFSGGKDSTAVLNVALEVARDLGRLPLRVVHFDEEVLSQDTVDYVERVSQLPEVDFVWYALPVPHGNACSRKEPWWYPWDPDRKDRWVREVPEQAITAEDLGFFPTQPPDARWSIPECTGFVWPPDQFGSVGLLMGIRAAESLTRWRAVVRRDVENYIIPMTSSAATLREATVKPPNARNVSKVYPIYDWSTDDVWVAPGRFGWDYNRTYDKMSMHGLPPEHQRVAPPWHTEALATMPYYKHCYPDLYDKMVDRVAGVNTALRWSKTELYAYGRDRRQKSTSYTWEEVIARLLQDWPVRVQRDLAKRVKDEIRWHHKRTDDPLLEDTPHPLTGLSWRFLYAVVSRGDPWGRKVATSTVRQDPEGRAAHWRKWEAERDRLIAQGRLDLSKRSGNLKVAPGEMPGETDEQDEVRF